MREKLGDILVRYYGVPQEEIVAALGATGFLGAELLRRGAIRESDLFRALAFQLGLAFVSPIADADISQKVIESIPPSIAAWEEIVPIARTILNGRARIVIATAHPERHALRHELEEITGATIQFAVATPSDLDRAMRRFYRASPLPVDTAEITQPSAPIDISDLDEHTQPSPVEDDEQTEEHSLSLVIPSEPDYGTSTVV